MSELTMFVVERLLQGFATIDVSSLDSVLVGS